MHAKRILTIWNIDDDTFVKGKEKFFYEDLGD